MAAYGGCWGWTAGPERACSRPRHTLHGGQQQAVRPQFCTQGSSPPFGHVCSRRQPENPARTNTTTSKSNPRFIPPDPFFLEWRCLPDHLSGEVGAVAGPLGLGRVPFRSALEIRSGRRTARVQKISRTGPLHATGECGIGTNGPGMTSHTGGFRALWAGRSCFRPVGQAFQPAACDGTTTPCQERQAGRPAPQPPPPRAQIV
jgi:hypothetical protein